MIDEPSAPADSQPPSGTDDRAADTAPLLQATLTGAATRDGVRTGFPSVDNLLGGGVRRGDLVVLGGDVGAGKSALALAIALRSAAAGHTVGYLSGEMAVARIIERVLALEARVKVDDLRRDTIDQDARLALGAAGAALRRRAPVLGQLPDLGVAGVSGFLAEHLDLELVIVDPLQFLALGQRPLDEELATAARDLKALAMRRATCVLAVSHLSPDVRQRSDPRPTIADFGGLGGIRQQADIVLGLFREELYDASPHVEGASELHVLKNRNGPTGFVDLYFYRQWLRFEDMVEPDR
jgi:replicative DNA helicase